MSNPRRGELMRGASLLAGLVFIGILGLVGLGLQASVANNPHAMVAAGGTTGTNSTAANNNSTVADILPPLKNYKVTCNNGSTVTVPIVSFACDQTTGKGVGTQKVTKISELKQTCSPGFTYTVKAAATGEVTVSVTPKQPNFPFTNCSTGRANVEIETKLHHQCSDGSTPLISYNSDQCEIHYCTTDTSGGESCTTINGNSSADGTAGKTTLGDTIGNSKTIQSYNQPIDFSKTGSAPAGQGLSGVFTSCPVGQIADGKGGCVIDLGSKAGAGSGADTSGGTGGVVTCPAGQVPDMANGGKTCTTGTSSGGTGGTAKTMQYCDWYPNSDLCKSTSISSAPPGNGTVDCAKDPTAAGCKSVTPPPSGGCTAGSSCFPSGPTSGSQNWLSSLLSGLMKGLGGSGSGSTGGTAASPGACSTDPNTYAQQQQQYQQALQNYNYQLQLYNQQVQINNQNGISSSGLIPPTQPQPCVPSTYSQCSTPPSQPAASSCTGGTWQPTYSGQCVTGWKCLNSSGAPVAQLSCNPQTADVGSTLAIAYSCSSGTASSDSFTVGDQTSGTATTSIAEPPQGTNAATYTLKCTDGSLTSGAVCTVQVNKPTIIFMAAPKTISSGESSTLGWITSGVSSCVVSSPDDDTFTADNAYNTSVHGSVQTPTLATTTEFDLNCATDGGSTRTASTTVIVQ